MLALCQLIIIWIVVPGPNFKWIIFFRTQDSWIMKWIYWLAANKLIQWWLQQQCRHSYWQTNQQKNMTIDKLFLQPTGKSQLYLPHTHHSLIFCLSIIFVHNFFLFVVFTVYLFSKYIVNDGIEREWLYDYHW